MPSSAMSGSRTCGFGLFLHVLLLAAVFVAPFVAAADANGALVIVPASGNYKYTGCYNETTNLNGTSGSRALDGGKHEIQPGNMTVETCISFCNSDSTPYKYAGLEFARECWCARDFNSNAKKVDDSTCDLPCDGNQTEACGGTLRLSVYQLSAGASLRTAYGVIAFATLGALATNLL